MSSKKSTQFTVFVRFTPPHQNLRRHHTEQWFAGVGPIKKSSLIHQDNKVYGFIKYTCQEDTEQAVKEYNNKTYKVDGDEVKVQMVLAEKASSSNKHVSGQTESTMAMDESDERRRRDTHEVYRKKACRLILRNLAFSATERDIRQALASFGALTEVHIPTVAGAPTHRGFAFVTFEKAKDANECLKAGGTLLIRKRPVQVAHSLNKAEYDSQKRQGEESERKRRLSHSRTDDEEKSDKEEKPAHDAGDGDDENAIDEKVNASDTAGKEEGDSTSDEDDDDDDDVSDDGQTNEGGAEGSQTENQGTAHKAALTEKRSLFLRNLPFDVSRHDLFQLFRKYGKIEAIYICKDVNGIAKGSAFLNYVKPAAAQRALQAAGTDSSDSLQDVGLLVNGRRVLVDLAIDKETAETLSLDKKHAGGKDRRHIYLRTEGRVDDQAEWEALPETDKEKRQRAWTDKSTKLKSPIFFINPTRLSFRNLSKHIDEAAFKKLLVAGTVKGLEKGLVSAQDQIALWKAKGEMSAREILAKIQEIEEGESGEKSILPRFDLTNVKRYIPSVYIDRDFTKGNGKDAPSRGFGFAQFEHHVHALACLRELNNNTEYTGEYVAGGNRALQARQKSKRRNVKDKKSEKTGLDSADGVAKLPRLIVEFTVENKVKAKQQIEHRAQQEANALKQKMDSKAEKKKEKKKKRGARQRENRRKAALDGDGAEPMIVDSTKTADGKKAVDHDEKRPKGDAKLIKPPKKRPKIDPNEEKFNKLVEAYKQSFVATSIPGEETSSSQKGGKRWFE